MPYIEWSKQLELIVRLLIAGICGCLIGYERKNRNKEAGVRTHIIVAIASCLMMEISKYGFRDLGQVDGARIAAQVVSGIGFLGAGMIFVQKNSVRGLTTAAGVWATSGIGMAIGAGMYTVGVVTTVIIVLFQVLMHKNFKFLHHQNSENMIFILKNFPEAIDELKSVMKDEELSYSVLSIKKLENNRIRLEISASFCDDFDMLEFITKIAQKDEVEEVYNE